MDDDFGLWELIVSMFWFMLLVCWIWLLIAIITDIFRDRSLHGAGKALWTLLIVFLPWLGALLYLIVRGNSMNERTRQVALDNQAAMRAYISESAGTSVSEELRGLAELRDSGVLTPAEYEQAKAKALA
jgi:Phospholipase_D-nuclease N-terminal/Short C-terminal domain